jgi:hypothetical protein
VVHFKLEGVAYALPVCVYIYIYIAQSGNMEKTRACATWKYTYPREPGATVLIMETIIAQGPGLHTYIKQNKNKYDKILITRRVIDKVGLILTCSSYPTNFNLIEAKVNI